MAHSFQKKIAGLSRKLVVEALKTPLRLSETETEELGPLIQKGVPHWHRSMKMRVASVQKQVNSDMKARRISLESIKNPARFLVNSIALHVLEQMLVSAGRFDSLKDLRSGDFYDHLHKHVEATEL